MPGPYRAWITDTSAPPGRNAHSPCGRREREEKWRRRKQADIKRRKKRASEGKWVTEWSRETQRKTCMPSLGEGVSLNTHAHKKTHQSQHSTHSHWIESAGENKQGISLLKYHSNHATVVSLHCCSCSNVCDLCQWWQPRKDHKGNGVRGVRLLRNITISFSVWFFSD